MPVSIPGVRFGGWGSGYVGVEGKEEKCIVDDRVVCFSSCYAYA
jgi:hypothetical protein